MSIVDTIFSGATYYKDWLRNAAGGAYNTLAGLTALPVQAGSAAAQLAKGKSWSEVEIPDPLKEGRAAFGEMTGLPTEKAEPGFGPAFGFGRGAVGGPTASAAVAGGALNAIAETYYADSPLTQVAINTLLPLAAIGGYRGVQALRKGSMRDVGKVTQDPDFPLSKGRASGKLPMMAEEDFLASHPASADKVATYKQAYSVAHKNKVKQFIDSALKSGDEDAGARAAIAWKKFQDSQLKKHRTMGQKEIENAKKLAGETRFIDISKAKKAMADLYEETAGLTMGDADQAIAKDLQARLKKLSSVNKMTLSEVDSQLQYFVDKATRPVSEIAPGVDAGVARKLSGVWHEVLDDARFTTAPQNAPAAVKEQTTKLAQAAKNLSTARKAYGTRAEDLKQIHDSVLGVFFNVGETGLRAEMNPTAVMEKLRGLKKPERDFFVAIMEQTDPGMVDVLRKNLFETAIENANIPGAAMRDPTWSSSKFLKWADENKEALDFLAPTKDQKKHLDGLLENLRKASQKTRVNQSAPTGTMEEIAGGASMAAGKPGAALVARGVMRTVADAMSDKNALADLFYGTVKQPETKTGRLMQTLRKTAEQSPFVINREITAASQAMKPTEEGFSPESLPPPPPEDFWLTPKQPEEQPQSNLGSLLDATSKVESNDNPNAIGPETKSGERALGQYQFMPKTAEQYGIDPMNPEQARMAADKHYQYLIKKYDGDLVKAIAAYNWGEGNVDRKGLDNMPEETRQYISKMLDQVLK